MVSFQDLVPLKSFAMASFLGCSSLLLIITTFVVTIAIGLQALLVLNNWTFSHLIYESLLSYSIYRARSLYHMPLTSKQSENIKHTLCLNPFTNRIVSCQLVGYNLLLSNILPNWDYIADKSPQTFIKKVRNPYTNQIMYTPPFGTVYEYLTISNLKSLLIYSTLDHNYKQILQNKGCIVYFHGGGFVQGSTFTNHRFPSYLHLFSQIPVLGLFLFPLLILISFPNISSIILIQHRNRL